MLVTKLSWTKWSVVYINGGQFDITLKVFKKFSS